MKIKSISDIVNFNQHKNGLCIHYEDLISNHYIVLNKILCFLNINYDLTKFDLSYHRQQSQKLYQDYKVRLPGSSYDNDSEYIKYFCSTQTQDDLYNFTYHSDKVNVFYRKHLDSYMEYMLNINTPPLYSKYLSRYKERQ